MTNHDNRMSALQFLFYGRDASYMLSLTFTEMKFSRYRGDVDHSNTAGIRHAQ